MAKSDNSLVYGFWKTLNSVRVPAYAAANAPRAKSAHFCRYSCAFLKYDQVKRR